MDLRNALPATFEAQIGTEFELAADPAIVLVLAEVERMPAQPGAPRAEPFSMVFTGPARPQLDQAIHHLRHESLGELEIFLVPVGYDSGGQLRYEAVFN